MPTTLYKGYSVPTTGTESGTWGVDINTNSFAVIDANVGGVVTITVSNVNVTLSAPQAQNAILRVIGTLTGNVVVTTPTQGFVIVENATTGAFTLSILGSIGAAVTVAQGLTTLVILDTVNGARLAGVELASGTVTLFVQAAAPVGWTKLTTINDRALRIVSTTGGVVGGTTVFSSVFSARTISVAQLPAHNHAVTDPGHSHLMGMAQALGGYGLTAGGGYTNSIPTIQLSGLGTTVSGTGIAIQNTGTGATVDFSVQYVDAILAQKN